MIGQRERGTGTALWLAVGGLLIAIGVSRGELAEILARAIRVCLQCIGIG